MCAEGLELFKYQSLIPSKMLYVLFIKDYSFCLTLMQFWHPHI